MATGKNYTVGIFNDENSLMTAVKNVRGAGIKIEEVFSPYPVHGLDGALGYKMTRLPIAAFFFGLTGTTLALVMLFWMMGYDWPMIIGGKNFASVPPFIPVTFELTVLLSAFGMVFTFFVASDLKPWAKPRVFDARCTNDMHVMAIDLDVNSTGKEEINRLLNDAGALEVNDKNFN
jgi:hypothetical protein